MINKTIAKIKATQTIALGKHWTNSIHTKLIANDIPNDASNTSIEVSESLNRLIFVSAISFYLAVSSSGKQKDPNRSEYG